jgi:hypothetical protein
MAARQGLTLEKSPRRDPRALGYDRWRLTGPYGRIPAPETDRRRDGYDWTLDQIETYLAGEHR